MPGRDVGCRWWLSLFGRQADKVHSLVLALGPAVRTVHAWGWEKYERGACG